MRPGRRLVMNIVTVEHLGEAVDFMKTNGYAFEISYASVARSKALSEKLFMVAGNPVNVVLGIKI